MSLFDRLKLDELNTILSNISFNRYQTRRHKVAHFCEHDGICIRFTPARSTWHALAPCALKPWWLLLKPVKENLHDDLTQQTEKTRSDKITKNAATKAEKIEVTK